VKRYSLLKKAISGILAGVLCFSAVSLASAEEYGVDISRYQGNINWSDFAKTNNSFVILRAGTSKYGIDSRYEEYYKGTREAGVKTGAYLYISALTLEEFKAAAEQFIRLLDGKEFEMPVYIDLEDDAQTALGRQTLTTYALACMNIIRDAGYKTGLYSNLNWLRNFIDKQQVEKAGYEIWYAQYPEAHANPNDYDKSDMGGIWQYSSQGTVGGIPESEVDLNVAYRIYDVEREMSGAGWPYLIPYLSRKSMRSGPGNEYGELFRIPQNTALRVTERVKTDDGEWGMFEYNGYVGWCSLDGVLDYSSAQIPENPYLFYDVNLDGEINAADDAVLLKYILGDSRDGLSADLNGDGKVNVFDRQRLRAYITDSSR